MASPNEAPDQSHAADQALPPSLIGSFPGKLPNETLYHIASYLDEPGLKAVASMCRRLYAVMNPELYKHATTSPLRGQRVLLWAADGPGRHNVLEYVLRQGVNPNALYHSFITKTRLDDVFAAQGGRRGSADPVSDWLLQTEINHEKDCRNSMYQTHIDRFNDRTLQNQFGPVANQFPWTRRHYYWRWAPIHLAAYRGDDKAIGILLDHGADINQPSSGLCDCTMPGVLSGEYTAPGKYHPVWTSLHTSICRGHQSTVQLLVTRGASLLVGGFRSKLEPGSGRSVTAFHSAALKGSVEICKILLDGPFRGRLINHLGPSGYSALDLAAASGHIKSVFKFLCNNGAKLESPGTVNKLNTLVTLCLRYKHDEAIELLRLARAREIKVTPKICNEAMTVVCRIDHPIKYGTETLRTLQDMRRNQNTRPQAGSPRPIKNVKETSKPMRMLLAIRLIEAGADPNGQSDFSDIPRQTHLKCAITSNFLPLVELLIRRGADCTNPGTCRVDATSGHLDMTADAKDYPLWCALEGNYQGAEEDDRVAIFCALLRAGALSGMSLEHKEELFVRAARVNRAFKPLRELAKHCPPESISNETMTKMLEITVDVEDGKLDEETARWILQHYVARFQAPDLLRRSAAQEALADMSLRLRERGGYSDLVTLVLTYVLEHTSMSCLPRHVAVPSTSHTGDISSDLSDIPEDSNESE